MDHRCIFTGRIMAEPVIAVDGYTYEKEAIEEWFIENDTSPVTALILKHKNLMADSDKKSEIVQFLKNKNVEFYRDEVYLPKSYWQDLLSALIANDIALIYTVVNRDPRLFLDPILDNKKGITVFHLVCLNYLKNYLIVR